LYLFQILPHLVELEDHHLTQSFAFDFQLEILMFQCDAGIKTIFLSVLKFLILIMPKLSIHYNIKNRRVLL